MRRVQILAGILGVVLLCTLAVMEPAAEAIKINVRTSNSWTFEGWVEEPFEPAPRGWGWLQGELVNQFGAIRVLCAPDVALKCSRFQARTVVYVDGYHELEPHRHVVTKVNIRKR
jgi:hypothetical protein